MHASGDGAQASSRARWWARHRSRSAESVAPTRARRGLARRLSDTIRTFPRTARQSHRIHQTRSPPMSDILDAIQHDDADAVARLPRPSLDAPLDVVWDDTTTGLTPLMWAVLLGRLEIVRLLL